MYPLVSRFVFASRSNVGSQLSALAHQSGKTLQPQVAR